jgi:anthraniloyl-CoA monooxygenase
MRIACLGGGPAGLYFSILMKKANPTRPTSPCSSATSPDDTFGWGVVFSDKTMGGFRAADAKVVDQIERAFRHWDDIDVHFKGRKFTSSGHGFCGIARKKLLEIFQRRAEELGVTMNFQTHMRSRQRVREAATTS